MSRRPISLILSVVLVVLLVLLGVVTEFVTPQGWSVLELIEQQSRPLLVITVVLIIGVTVWLYSVEHPISKAKMWTSPRPPYPGLDAFTEDDTEVFFGRETETIELFDRLHPRLPDQAHRFVVVIGPSGAGKSSLVQAGLLPRLVQQRNRWVIVPPLVPGQQPIRSLARSLAAAQPAISPDSLDALGTELAADPKALVRYVEQLRAAHGGRDVSALLVIDQAEELLTLTNQQERLDFLELLRAALRQDPKLWVVATLRSEFLTGMLEAGAADLFRNPLVIGPLNRNALFEVIEKPGALAGLTFAPGVITELVGDVGSGDALPLLAYTLQALYLRAGPGGTITAKDYRQLGGVTGTLTRQADQIVSELRTVDADTPVFTTLLKFVTLDENEPTRRRISRDLLTDTERPVVDAFIIARLLTTDVEDDDAVIQVAHEALFRQWAPLRQEIEAAADKLRQRAELERWAQDWERSGRRHSYLLQGERLRIAQQTADHGDWVAKIPSIREFLELSCRLDNAAMERLSEVVAQQALTAIDSDPEQGILLALAAIEECAATPPAHRALLAALANSRLRRILRGHHDMIWSVAWSPDSRRLATASGDGTVRIWNLASGAELMILRGHEGWVRKVAWSPDNRHLATASEDCTARIWDATNGTELIILTGHQNSVRAVAWSPDGKRLATGSRDATARIWDATNGTELMVLRGHQDAVRAVAWSPGSDCLITGSNDHTARVWDISHGTESATLRGHQEGICGVGWSPNGQQLATCSYDRTARIWDTDSGTELLVLRGHQYTVLEVGWSPNGQQLATCSYDRTARIWDTDSGTELLILRGHQDMVRGVAWSPDGQYLATASLDHTARIWETHTGTELLVLRGHQDMVWEVNWSPEGKRLATGSDDRTARIWDTNHGTELAVLCGHQSTVRGVAWSPEGTRLATGSDDRTARIWDTDSGRALTILRSHQDSIRAVAWSPDGQRLATGSDDRTIRLWDTVHDEKSVVLYGHEDWTVDVAWSPDGQYVATASLDRTARIWDVDSGTQLAVLDGHQDAIWGISWSPDGKRLATGSDDRTARIWDVDGTQLAVLHGHHDAVRRVAWSPDGKRLATGSDDRTVRIWDVVQIWDAAIDLNTLVIKARSRVFRELTDDERRSAMLPERAG